MMRWPSDPFNQLLVVMAASFIVSLAFLIVVNLLMDRAIKRAGQRAGQQMAERPSPERELYPDLASKRVVFRARDFRGEFILRMDASAAREFAGLLHWAAEVIDPEGEGAEKADGAEAESAAVQTSTMEEAG